MELTLILIFLVFSALFSGLEIAFVSSNKLKVELRKKKGAQRSQILAGFYEKPSVFIGSMLIGNNIVMVALTYFATQLLNPRLQPFIGDGFLLMLTNTILITMVVLLFGEFLPKTIFRLYADQILYLLAYPVQVLLWLLSPVAWLFNKLSLFVIRLVMRTETVVSDPVFTRLDLERFIMESGSDAEGEVVDREMFGNALNLKEIRVRDCMVPRPEIECIDINAGVEELEDLFRETKLSRILVIEDDIDNVLGYVHHQQLLERPRSIRSIRLEILFVPEVMRVSDLLHKFIAERVNIICVVDEFGGVAGLITLEDILEEIFGEIEDEHDEEEYIEQQISETEYLLSGRLEIDYLNEKFPALHLPEGEYHTLSGYLVMTIGSIPQQGEEIELNGTRFILEQVSETKIETVKVLK
ncbi:MAG: HlyC/CorC family transporter [Saprospiraceae bacterium]|nr:HlyC/CorC family transporter [Saprospiraceae bacterium]